MFHSSSGQCCLEILGFLLNTSGIKLDMYGQDITAILSMCSVSAIYIIFNPLSCSYHLKSLEDFVTRRPFNQFRYWLIAHNGKFRSLADFLFPNIAIKESCATARNLRFSKVKYDKIIFRINTQPIIDSTHNESYQKLNPKD